MLLLFLLFVSLLFLREIKYLIYYDLLTQLNSHEVIYLCNIKRLEGVKYKIHTAFRIN